MDYLGVTAAFQVENTVVSPPEFVISFVAAPRRALGRAIEKGLLDASEGRDRFAWMEWYDRKECQHAWWSWRWPTTTGPRHATRSST